MARSRGTRSMSSEAHAGQMWSAEPSDIRYHLVRVETSGLTPNVSSRVPEGNGGKDFHISWAAPRSATVGTSMSWSSTLLRSLGACALIVFVALAFTPLAARLSHRLERSPRL